MAGQALTPTFSPKRERAERSELQRNDEGSLSNSQTEGESSLSRLRERARVRARGLREQQTDAEALLWRHLRNRQISGLKFRRQHLIAGYFADFACVEIGLVVELDGGQHAEQADYDATRADVMAAEGFTTLRFWNNEVLNQTDSVMEKIRQTAAALTPALSRKRERE